MSESSAYAWQHGTPTQRCRARLTLATAYVQAGDTVVATAATEQAD